MRHRNLYQILFAAVIFCGCNSTQKIVTTYYAENEQVLNNIEQSFKTLYRQRPFSIEFTDRSFNFFSIEIMTDSLKYIYEFGINEKRIKDTLLKYALNKEGILDIITQMRSIQCTWINNLDFYVDQEKHSLVFISMRPVELSLSLIHI